MGASDCPRAVQLHHRGSCLGRYMCSKYALFEVWVHHGWILAPCATAKSVQYSEVVNAERRPIDPQCELLSHQKPLIMS